jgi:hypothetical protein
MPKEPSTAELTKPRRRWFQFRLRTLLIGTAVLGSACGYVVHEAKIVAQRSVWLDAHGMDMLYLESMGGDSLFHSGDRDQEPSRIRLLLGDVSYHRIILNDAMPIAEKKAAAAIFPESDVYVVPPLGAPIESFTKTPR